MAVWRLNCGARRQTANHRQFGVMDAFLLATADISSTKKEHGQVGPPLKCRQQDPSYHQSGGLRNDSDGLNSSSLETAISQGEEDALSPLLQTAH